MNCVHLLGTISQSPEVKELEGTCSVEFSVCVANKHKKRTGEIYEQKFEIPCVAWDSGARLIHKFFKKGSKIIVHGKIFSEDSFFVRVESFEFV